MTQVATYSMDALPDLNGRGAFTIYCDDVRQELSGKSTMVGVYGNEMYVAEFPAVLPTFSIVTSVWTVQSRPFQKLIFRVLLDDTVLSEEVLDIEQAQKLWNEAVNQETLKPNPLARQLISRVARFSPFVLEKEAALRVRVETEDGELRTSGLGIRLPPSQDGSEPPSG